MVFVFNIIGWFLVIVGLLIASLPVLGVTISGASEFVGGAGLAVPGLGIAFFGLLCMAIAGVLDRLDKIVLSNADTADTVEDMLKHLKGQG